MTAPGSAAAGEEETHTVRLLVNGARRELRVPARRLLSDALRDEAGLTGTHVGCEAGVCGACTVLLEDQPVRSCLVLAVQADGRRVETVEGLRGPDGEPHPLQAAIARHRGLQCGFCTSGFLMLGAGWLRRGPSREAARECVAANVCRCTGYAGLVAAFEEAAEEHDRRHADQPPDRP
ncbi:(2Fe-2S)-binding protein [Streptomyces sp. 4N509B]|uniref:(2Fe-2S)-binding protein n=1 Tax=Streptomyces sp. 4N509B TaxID=3457413 RepID=UPI003FD4AC3B